MAEMEAAGLDVEGAAAMVAGFSGFTGPKISCAKVDLQLQEASKFKTEGNAFYREKNMRSAIGRYHRSLLVLRGLDSDVMTAMKGFGPEAPVLIPEQEELLRNIQVDCYNNLAACLLQKENVDYNRVREYCLCVLQRRPGDVKALYRAGVATLELGDAQTAKQYLIQASRGQPHDANVRKHLKKAEEKLSRELQKEKAMYRGMFSSNLQGGDSGEECINQSNGAGEAVEPRT